MANSTNSNGGDLISNVIAIEICSGRFSNGRGY